MKKNKNSGKIYLYEIEYASGLLRNNGRQGQIIISNKELKNGQFIIVEHIGCGIFIGKVKGTTLGDTTDSLSKEVFDISDAYEYRYIQDVDVSKWWDKIQREERMEQLREEMENKFEEIDKKKKFEYYSQIDDGFRELFLEYKELSDKNDEDN